MSLLESGVGAVTAPECDQPVRILEHHDERRTWRHADISERQWRVVPPPGVESELAMILATLRRAPLPLLLRTPHDHELPACRALMMQVKRTLTEGIGLCVVGALPCDASTEELTAIYWMLGQYLATPVATRWDGTMLYDVTDTGKAFGPGVRGSATNVQLSFHTDNAFGISLPDYVGLLCIRPAARGGESQFSSLYTVHRELQRRHPRLLRRLYEPCYSDRQAEHAPGAPPVLRAPLLHTRDGALVARLTPNLVRRGHALMGEPMDALLEDALLCVERLVASEDLCVGFRLQAGELQYLHNHWCAHFRSSFTDVPDPRLKRHLVRVWYRERGGRAYDG